METARPPEIVTRPPGLLSRLRGYLGIGPFRSSPGPATPGPAGYSEDGWIPLAWGVNFGQRGYDPRPSGWNATVYACIMLYARTIATMPGKHQRRREDNGTDTVENSALARVLKKPNAYQTRSDFSYNLVSSVLAEGNGYGLAIRNARFEIDSLHLLNPRTVSPLIEPETGEVFYSVGGNALVDPLIDGNLSGSGRLVVPARDMLHVRVFCPDNPLIGVSPIQFAAVPIATNTLGSMQMATFYSNMSRPSGVLKTSQILTSEQVTELRKRWQEQSAGLNAGGVPILTAGLEFQGVSVSAQDAQLVETLKFSVADIARVFGVPLALINDMTGSTWANVEQLMRFWMSQGLGFYVNHFELAYDKLFEIERAADYTELDMEELLRPEFAARIDGLAKAVQGGIYSPDEARRKEGLAKVADGAGVEPRVQQQLVPLSYGKDQKAPDPNAQVAPAAPVPANDNPADDEDEDEAPEDTAAKLWSAIVKGRGDE